LESLQGLPDYYALQPGTVGRWSVRDILAHISTWEEEFMKVLPLILEGKRLPRYDGIDVLNDREQQRKRDLSLEEVREQLTATHERLMSMLRGRPEVTSRTANRLRRRLRLDTYGHYRETDHAGQIGAWRKTTLL
jgi:uncharacterized damage-inducible protein DinB